MLSSLSGGKLLSEHIFTIGGENSYPSIDMILVWGYSLIRGWTKGKKIKKNVWNWKNIIFFFPPRPPPSLAPLLSSVHWRVKFFYKLKLPTNWLLRRYDATWRRRFWVAVKCARLLCLLWDWNHCDDYLLSVFKKLKNFYIFYSLQNFGKKQHR